MGYYSDWQLTIAAVDFQTLGTLVNWMFDYSNGVLDPNLSSDERAVMKEILNSVKVQGTDPYVVFGHDSTKCDTTWSTVIDDIRKCVFNNSALDFEYVRIGEDYDDIEAVTGQGHIETGVTRTIEPPLIDAGFMSVPITTVSIPAPVCTAPPPKPPEEQCSVCKHMKDVGDKCWCCGN